MALRLNGATSGFVELDAPAAAGSNTLTLPTGNGNADQVLSTNGSGTLSFVDRGRMTLATAQNSTSGTSIDFTGIPSWVKRITVMFNGVSTSGVAGLQIQIGTSSGIETTGYIGSSGTQANSSAFTINGGSSAAATTYSGIIVIANFSSNTWTQSGVLGRGDGVATVSSAGAKSLSAVLTQLRVTTSGTDTFDAGSINIMYEG